MNYQIKAISVSKQSAFVVSKTSKIKFGITANSAEELPNPAELFLGSFASCVLKNVERFSSLMKFTYTNADITVNSARSENPPRMNDIEYHLILYSNDKNLNINLLKKNLEKFGTIYNTIKLSCNIIGDIKVLKTSSIDNNK